MVARGSDRGRLARRLRARARRGAALLEVLLALLVAAIAVLGANKWLDIQRFEGRARDAGRSVAVLADAARLYAQAHYERLYLLSAGEGVSLATLRDPDVRLLPAHFPDGDSMKRDLTVVALNIPDGPDADTLPDGVRVLAGQAPGADDTRRPHAALTQGQASQRLGMVEANPARCDSLGVAFDASIVQADKRCLVGPAVAADISGFDGRHGLTLRTGAVMALYEYVHADFCGAFVHRVPTAICQNANVVEQPLLVTGRVLNAASITTVDQLVVHGALTVRGKLNTGAFTAGGRMTVGTGMTVGGATTIHGTGGAANPVCVSAPPSALCSEDRVIVGETLTVSGTANVRGPAHVDSFFSAAGGIRNPTGCVDINGVATVAGRARVSSRYSDGGAGSCP